VTLSKADIAELEHEWENGLVRYMELRRSGTLDTMSIFGAEAEAVRARLRIGLTEAEVVALEAEERRHFDAWFSRMCES
jgi:hypothetical protein